MCQMSLLLMSFKRSVVDPCAVARSHSSKLPHPLFAALASAPRCRHIQEELSDRMVGLAARLKSTSLALQRGVMESNKVQSSSMAYQVQVYYLLDFRVEGCTGFAVSVTLLVCLKSTCLALQRGVMESNKVRPGCTVLRSWGFHVFIWMFGAITSWRATV